MHVLPQLRKLEDRYPNELAVVGVHSGKFHAERMTANIRQAVMRLRVEHPVVNDRYFRIWRSFGVNAWPTLVLLDPNGRLVDSHPGEITFESYEPLVRQIVESFDAAQQLDRNPLPLRLESRLEPARHLSFPGKLLSVEPNRLFIADSAHHRIILAELSQDGQQARVEAIVGSGQPSLLDGPYQAAGFRYPQGMALDGDRLYVADTENHAIRAIDFLLREVRTVAGTGEQARGISLGLIQPARLSSPWDLSIKDGTMYIAMAGRHQLWSMDLAGGDLRPFAGSGAEELYDGPARQAALAQPTGIADGGDWLYFADSESSAVRRVQARPGGRVETVVGVGLFDFGDRDGVGDEARLQHAQGVTFHRDKAYVADTYNNKIKLVDPGNRSALTLVGAEAAGYRDGEEAMFWEPGGVCALNGKLYVADTNNHVIRIVDPDNRRVSTLQLEGFPV